MALFVGLKGSSNIDSNNSDSSNNHSSVSSISKSSNINSSDSSNCDSSDIFNSDNRLDFVRAASCNVFQCISSYCVQLMRLNACISINKQILIYIFFRQCVSRRTGMFVLLLGCNFLMHFGCDVKFNFFLLFTQKKTIYKTS